MAKIPSTTLLTLPDGSRVELRVVPAGHTGGDTDQLEEYLEELGNALQNADSEAEDAESNLGDMRVDTDDIAERASDAISGIDGGDAIDKDDMESSIGNVQDAVGKAQQTLAKIKKLVAKPESDDDDE
jgi:uncharacterized protein YukE